MKQKYPSRLAFRLLRLHMYTERISPPFDRAVLSFIVTCTLGMLCHCMQRRRQEEIEKLGLLDASGDRVSMQKPASALQCTIASVEHMINCSNLPSDQKIINYSPSTTNMHGHIHHHAYSRFALTNFTNYTRGQIRQQRKGLANARNN